MHCNFSHPDGILTEVLPTSLVSFNDNCFDTFYQCQIWNFYYQNLEQIIELVKRYLIHFCYWLIASVLYLRSRYCEQWNNFNGIIPSPYEYIIHLGDGVGEQIQAEETEFKTQFPMIVMKYDAHSYYPEFKIGNFSCFDRKNGHLQGLVIIMVSIKNNYLLYRYT